MCWLYLFLQLLLNWYLVPEGVYLIHFEVHSPLMVQNLICAQNWLQARVPISFHKSKDKMEALEDEFHDLGNMFNFQTFCLLSVIKCVIYLSKIKSIALIFSFLVLNQTTTTRSSSSCSSKGGTRTTVSIDE